MQFITPFFSQKPHTRISTAVVWIYTTAFDVKKAARGVQHQLFYLPQSGENALNVAQTAASNDGSSGRRWRRYVSVLGRTAVKTASIPLTADSH